MVRVMWRLTWTVGGRCEGRAAASPEAHISVQLRPAPEAGPKPSVAWPRQAPVEIAKGELLLCCCGGFDRRVPRSLEATARLQNAVTPAYYDGTATACNSRGWRTGGRNSTGGPASAGSSAGPRSGGARNDLAKFLGLTPSMLRVGARGGLGAGGPPIAQSDRGVPGKRPRRSLEGYHHSSERDLHKLWNWALLLEEGLPCKLALAIAGVS